MKTAKSAMSRLFSAVPVDGFTKEAEVRDGVRGSEALSRVAGRPLRLVEPCSATTVSKVGLPVTVSRRPRGGQREVLFI